MHRGATTTTGKGRRAEIENRLSRLLGLTSSLVRRRCCRHFRQRVPPTGPGYIGTNRAERRRRRRRIFSEWVICEADLGPAVAATAGTFAKKKQYPT